MATRKWIDAIRKFKYLNKGFSGSLGLAQGAIYTQSKSHFDMEMNVFSSLCLPRTPSSVLTDTLSGASHEAGLGLSSVLAWFDEVSTLGIMIKDKQHRPGQSLNLEINRMPALQSVQPGDKVYVRSRPRKVGKSVAFCDLELYRIPTPSSGTVDDSHVDSEREVLATGRHTKYLDMGKAWDVATHPLLISTARKYSQRYFENNQHTPDDKNPSCSVKGGGVDVIGSTWKGLGLQTGSQVNPIEDFLMSYPPGTRKYNATLEVSAATQNPMGNLHGGAAACAAEMAVALAQDAWEQDSTTSAPYTREDLVSMSADFMRPSKGKVLVLVTRLFESPAIEVSFISYKSKDMEPSCKVVCVMGQQGRKD